MSSSALSCACLCLPLPACPQNQAEALRYFRKAADKQNGLGLYGLGFMYLSGTAVNQDYDTAFKKLQAAADAGDRDAHFYLGSMYYHVRLVVVVVVVVVVGWKPWAPCSPRLPCSCHVAAAELSVQCCQDSVNGSVSDEPNKNCLLVLLCTHPPTHPPTSCRAWVCRARA